MECERISELLPWLANGSLEGEEHSEANRHLAVCQKCSRELDETLFALNVYQQHVPAEALVDYAFGQPVITIDRRLIDSHLRTCPECSEQFEMARASRVLEETEALKVAPLISVKPARQAFLRRYAAIAASLIAFIAAGGWLLSQQQERATIARFSEQQQQMSDRLTRLEAESRGSEAENQALKEAQSQLEQQKEEVEREVARLQRRVESLASPQLNAPTLDVYPSELTERAEGRTINELTIPRSARSVTLILNSQSSTTYPNYSIEIVNARNRLIWRGQRLLRQSTNDYTINIPTSLLPPGSYDINVYGRSGGNREKVDSYKIRIRRAGR